MSAIQWLRGLVKPITPDGFDFFTPAGYDKILREGTKVLENILDIQVSMIAAINGPVTVHSAQMAKG
jgi:hypothetical protein